MIFDALVIGGGPAGATAAALLARAGWSVVLLEKSAFPRKKVCGEYLSATSFPLLRLLEVDRDFAGMAGPPVQTVGLFTGRHSLTAPMPGPAQETPGGRALGREHLDSILIEAARRAGALILQPVTAVGLVRDGNLQVCTAEHPKSGTQIEIHARAVIAAHGSWERGGLATLEIKRTPRPSDLLAFKAHFTDAALAPGLMPLLAFPGGYGGMVRTDGGRTTLSCCIRRDVLQRRRACEGGLHTAGDTVLAHILDHCTAACAVLADARVEGRWLAAGPIRPGIRSLYRDGIFTVGNAGGEAHPVVAEGISMAMQGAWLLAELFRKQRGRVLAGDSEAVGRAYTIAWRRHFGARLQVSRLYAQLAMRPAATRILLPWFERRPGLLTLCTGFSGKVSRVVTDTPS